MLQLLKQAALCEGKCNLFINESHCSSRLRPGRDTRAIYLATPKESTRFRTLTQLRGSITFIGYTAIYSFTLQHLEENNNIPSRLSLSGVRIDRGPPLATLPTYLLRFLQSHLFSCFFQSLIHLFFIGI